MNTATLTPNTVEVNAVEELVRLACQLEARRWCADPRGAWSFAWE